MRSLPLLLVCACLLLLSPARSVSAAPIGCDLPWLPFVGMHTNEARIPIGNSLITLQICAANKESHTADLMLADLEAALPILNEHAGLRLQGALERTILLVETAELHNLNADGMLSADGIIYLHPKTPPWVVVHEAAHYWANPPNFSDLWLIEGYAEYLTSLAMADLGRDNTPHAPQPICDGKPLQTWAYEPPATSRCGYDVGAAVFQAIEKEIGREGLRATMSRLGEKSIAADTWDLLVMLNRVNNRDLTNLLKQPVFAPQLYSTLEERSRLWQNLRDAQDLAKPLGVSLPHYIGDQIDAFEFPSAAASLDPARKLLDAAESVNERCQQERLECVRPWASLPADPSQWSATTEHLIKAHGLLQGYTRLRQRAEQLHTELPQPLVQEVAKLRLEAQPQLATALDLLGKVPALEQSCERTKTDCRSYWLSAWQAADFGKVRATIDWLSELMPSAVSVEERCGTAVVACRNVWQADLSALSPAPQQALEQLTALLERVGSLESTCGNVAWNCRQGWQAALEQGGISQADAFIDQAQQQLPRIQEITKSFVPGPGIVSSMRSHLPLLGTSSALDLRAAQQAFAQGDVEQALALAEEALLAQRLASERQGLVIRLGLIGLGLLLCVATLVVLARSLRRSRLRTTP